MGVEILYRRRVASSVSMNVERRHDGARRSPPRRRSRAAGATHTGVVHAPGRPQPARVPGDPRRGLDPRRDQAARPGGRDHAAAGAPLRRRRRRAVQRHRRARPRRRVRHRRRARHRAGRRPTAAHRPPISTACARSSRTTSPYVADTVDLLVGRAARRRAAAGVRRRAVHRRQLPDRGSARAGPTSTPRR